MKILKLVFMTVLFLSICCTAENDQTSATAVDSLRLVPVDTIGVLVGDSTEMFGNILDAAVLPSGEVIIVDYLKRCASVFDSSGQFVRQIGRSGSGPGEFQFGPTNVLWLPGEELVAIREDATGDWLTYSPEGEFIEKRDLAENMIEDIVFIDESTSVAYTNAVEWNTLTVSYSVQTQDINTGDIISTIMFYENKMEPSSDFLPGYVMLAADGNGRLYLSKANSFCWSVEVYSREGELLTTLERTDVTDREIVNMPESAEVSPVIPGIDPLTLMTNSDDGGRMSKTTTIPEFHPIISALTIDGEGRLWSRRGGFPGDIWDVSDTEGNRIAVVQVVLPDSVCHNLIIESNEYIALDNRNSDYHRVYIMKLEKQ